MQFSMEWPPGLGFWTHIEDLRGRGQLRGMTRRLMWLLLIGGTP